MSPTRGKYDELLNLAAMVCDDQADEAAVVRLDELLTDDAAARQVYLRYVDVHMDLGRRMAPAVMPMSRPQSAGFSMPSRLLLAAAAVVTLALTAWFVMSVSFSPSQTVIQQAQGQGVAVLTDADNARWAESPAATALGTDLPTGVLKLDAGTAQIMFKSGAVVDLVGPAELRLDGVNQAHLSHGALRAYVPQQARGFTVNTDQGLQLVDLGTEFILWTDGAERCKMQVLSGQVMVFETAGAQERFNKVINAHQGAERTTAGRMILHEQVNAAFLEPWARLGMVAARGTVLGVGTQALIGGDSTDPENDGDPDRDINYNAVFFGNDEANFGEGEAAFNVFDNQLGAGNQKWCCGSGDRLRTTGMIVGARFDHPGVLRQFTVASSNDSPHRDPTHWKIQGSADGETWVDIFEQKADQPLWTDRNQVISFEAGVDYAMQPESYRWYRYIALQTAGRSLDEKIGEHALGEIELFVDFDTAANAAPHNLQMQTAAKTRQTE